MLKTLKDNIDDFADLNKLCLLDSESSIDVSRNFVARLYDQKGKMKSAHDNLNRLRVKEAGQIGPKPNRPKVKSAPFLLFTIVNM